jgi:hypothetical protein
MQVMDEGSRRNRQRGGNLRAMITALVYALIAAVIVGLFGWAVAKPRSVAGRWLRRAWWWLFSRKGDEAITKRVDEIERILDGRIDTLEVALTERIGTLERSVERIATELAQRRCDQEGNLDDEYYSDWYRWFIDDPDADVDYSRKQKRDLARLRNGDFQHGA